MNQQAQLPALLQVSPPSRLLVVAAGHVGNNVFCTPAIQLLRNALPHSTIDVVALNYASAAVFEANAAIARVHVVRWSWQMARLASRYDRVICLHPKSAGLLKQVSVPVSVMSRFDGNRHYAEQILAFAASLVGRPIEDRHCRYHLAAIRSNRFDAVVNSRVSVSDNTRKNPHIGIHLGCGRTAIHGWKFFYRKRDVHSKLCSTESYVALAEHLRHIFPNALFVITGTRNERFLARRFAKTMKAVDLTGKTSVIELAGIIEELDLFITQDCGVLHVAATTSTPLLALFGPTCPALTGPWPLASHHRILQAASMAEITPQIAASSAVELLRKQSATQEITAPIAKKTLITALAVWLQQHHWLDWGYAASSQIGLL